MAGSKRKPISVWVERQLWATSGGRCLNPDCKNPDLIKLFDNGDITTLQEIAHIIPHSPGGPRGHEGEGLSDRDTFENLMLLCPTCHTLVDNVPNQYPAKLLRQWKRERIEKVNTAFNMPIYEKSSDAYQAIKQLESRNHEIAYNLRARIDVLQQVLPFLEPIDRVVTEDEINKLEQTIASLQEHEKRYRQRIKKRFAEEAEYYVELAGETTEATQLLDERKSKEPRSARRIRKRVKAEYHEWKTFGQEIRKVELNNLREGVDKYPCIIMLGDPGSGKTTTLENLAYQFADDPDILPLPLRLSEFKAGMSLNEFIRLGWGGSLESNHWGVPELVANLKGYLEEGKLFFLFDALNEMPQEEYSKHAQELRLFIDQWTSKGNRFIVTCRVLDYGEELSGLQRIEVQPLNDDQIQEFLTKELSEDWHDLWLELTEGERRLLEMTRNPYLLTMMIDVYVEDGQLFQNRADLLRQFTHILMNWAREKTPPEQWLDALIQGESLAVLAYEMQDRSGSGAAVETSAVKTVMPQHVQINSNYPAVPSPPDEVLSLATSANIIEMPVDRSSVRFYHQLLQEYFAARELLKRDPAGLIELWRWPWLESEMPLWIRPEDNYDPLPPPPPIGWEETTILASGLAAENDDQLVRALLQVNPVLAGRCLYEGHARVDKAVRQMVIDHLIEPISIPEVALRVRIAAGEVLGYLGDPRLGEFVTVPAGEFLMGDDEGSDDEEPQHELFLPSYQFGKYPVTNAEYRRFVENGCYSDRRWWTKAGWKAKENSKWTEPRWSDESRYNKPNQPVVGVSWYECVAFCMWLSAETGVQYRLPTEAEWEKAARGVDGRQYPWGDEFEADRLNSRNGAQAVLAATPVGIYPKGESPYEAYDCAGNVWEWCATRWGKAYPYDVQDEEWRSNYLEGDFARVLRGGAFYDYPRRMRCASRLRLLPVLRGSGLGFRVVVSPS